MNNLQRRFLFSAITLLALGLSSCNSGDSGRNAGGGGGEGGDGEEQIRVAFVPNLPANFWTYAKVGCQDAEEELGIKVEFRIPSSPTAVDQKRVVEDLLNSGVQAIAISPKEPDNQTEELNKWAAKVPLITTDSDAPKSNRLMYIGPNNYLAGKKSAALVRKALPEGGKLVICVGDVTQDNSKHRRQGLIDELLGREQEGEIRLDPTEGVIEGDKYTILTTLLDTGVQDVAKRKAADAITKYGDELDCMVGLYEYNPPAILQALKQAGKINKVKIVGFDENFETLQGIKDGTIEGTVIQDPYQYGYNSVVALKAILEGDNSVIPDNDRQWQDIPTKTVTTENVDQVMDSLKSKLAAAK